MALEARQAEALRHHALAGKGRIAVQKQRQHRVARACAVVTRTSSILSCLARTLPRTTGFTISRWLGLAVSERWTSLPSNSRSDEAPR